MKIICPIECQSCCYCYCPQAWSHAPVSDKHTSLTSSTTQQTCTLRERECVCVYVCERRNTCVCVCVLTKANARLCTSSRGQCSTFRRYRGRKRGASHRRCEQARLRKSVVVTLFFVFRLFFAASTNSDFCHTELIQSRGYVKSVPLWESILKANKSVLIWGFFFPDGKSDNKINIGIFCCANLHFQTYFSNVLR